MPVTSADKHFVKIVKIPKSSEPSRLVMAKWRAEFAGFVTQSTS